MPCCCSEISSLGEIGRGAALLFDPHDSGAIADALKRILEDAELRAELRELEAELEEILADIVRLNRELMELYEKGTTVNDIALHKRYINN
ncbi:MAG: hypothetical protein J6Y54_03170, partial [Lentisphaeria bacterium]|nr:hypothetical protein [Lentisphaeria bacterium]